ncbi:MAG: fibrinogen-like YCDxxxxGGGW domain-containing protein [Candidatus Aureabacteria bacterium]|nr:fibrinogen-like YCDxxxxGGGW domain-containing protein [Candidatus Auribacterota bacterium]
MKKLITVALSLLFAVGLSGFAVAGSLDSPGAPSAGSGMYTLQNLYDYLTSGTALTVQTSFQEPSAAPGSTMKTTKEIGDAIKDKFNLCAATADNVEQGVTFFCTQTGSWGVQTGALVALPRPTATPTITPTPTPTATAMTLAASCKAWKDGGYNTDGIYWIDPDGGSDTNKFQAYCDMTADGGGWTLVVRIVNDDNHETSGAYATLSDPGQAGSAKLADSTINVFPNKQLYRFSCGTVTRYYDATIKVFCASCGAAGTITKSKATLTGDWCTSSATYSNLLGLSGYSICDPEPNFNTYAVTDVNNYGCSEGSSGNHSGTVFVR